MDAAASAESSIIDFFALCLTEPYLGHMFSQRETLTPNTHSHKHTHPPAMAPSNHQQRLINRLPQGLFLFGFYSLNTCWASIVSNDYSFFRVRARRENMLTPFFTVYKINRKKLLASTKGSCEFSLTTLRSNNKMCF